MLLTRKEAAASLGKSLRQLDRICKQGKIHREPEDGDIRIRKSEIIRFQGVDADIRKERLSLSSHQNLTGGICR